MSEGLSARLALQGRQPARGFQQALRPASRALPRKRASSVMETRTRPIGRREALIVLLAGAGVAAGTFVAAAVEVGEKAPDFTLPSTIGEKVSLSQFRGKKLVLLEFYVHNFGPT